MIERFTARAYLPIVAILTLLAVPSLAAAARPAETGRHLVVFGSSTLPRDADRIVSAAGGATARKLPNVGVLVARGDAAFAAAIARHPGVLAVGPERVWSRPEVIAIEAAGAELAESEAAPLPQDNLVGYQWDMRRIGAPAVWARLPLPTEGRVATVAVLDTGVMDDHPDLAGQVVLAESFTYCNTVGANGSKSYPAYSTLIDFDAHPEWDEEDGCTEADTTYESHGTHVAGTIASKFGGGRVVGVAPDARIAAYKVFDRYRYTDEDGELVDAVGAFDGPLFQAIVDATDRGIPVISMSLGSYAIRSIQGDNAAWLAWNRVAQYANRGGTLVVASAGNEALVLQGQLAHVPSDVPTILSTSATGWSALVQVGAASFDFAPGSHDVLAFYSNVGSEVDLTAPGGDCGPDPDACLSPYLILNAGIRETNPGAGSVVYYFMAGTSMATPHVSAVAAMVRALHPELTPGEVRSFLKETAEPIGPRLYFGHGMIDADAATR